MSALVAVVVAVVVLLLAAAVVLGLRARAAHADAQAREQALAAARSTALALTSIDAEQFDADVQRVLDGATGAFREDFTRRLPDLQGPVVDNAVRAEGRVLEAALARADRRTATALVVVDSTVSTRAVPEGRVSPYRMTLTLESDGGAWRTAAVEFVP